MHANRGLVTGFLKRKLKFRGFVISDWEGIDRITYPPHKNYSYSILESVNAGVDMVLWFPYNYTEFINGLTDLVNKKAIRIQRIDDAVKRILRVKFAMGLFENPLADYSFADKLGSKEHRELAREAVRKSLVLLKNGKSAKSPVGQEGNNLTAGTTILKGIQAAVDPNTKVVFRENPNPKYVKSQGFSHAIVVVGEPPYAETAGDNLNLTLPYPGPGIINNVCGAVKCVVVIVSGRPLVIESYVPKIDALVAAWLPGSEGQGVADVLFGDYGFTGKLARTWFKRVDQLPMNVGDKHYDPLFPFGFGLETKPSN
ncbi:hypothetical protein NC652_020031 [Populus alba x Populus x berolinensis]|nr:hypothetical protein NC652_020031 [Populus alba x Populus x berolinensis]